MPTVFITGATKNTGFAIAEKFAGEGFDVAISSRNGESAEAAAAKIREKYNVAAKGYALDLLSVESIRGVFARIKDDFGRLDTFVANSADLGIGIDILSEERDIPITLCRLSKIKNLEVEDLSEKILNNAKRLFFKLK